MAGRAFESMNWIRIIFFESESDAMVPYLDMIQKDLDRRCGDV